MGLLEALLGKENPAAVWANDNSNYLGALGAGLASGHDLSSGLSSGLQMVPQAKALDLQQRQKLAEEQKQQQSLNATVQYLKQNRPDLAQMVEAGMPISEAWAQVLTPAAGGGQPTAEMRNYQFAQENPGFQDFLTNRGGPAEMSLQPTWMQDAEGNWFIGQMTKDGRVVRTQTPEGMSPVPPADVAGAKAGAQADAKTAANARAALPAAEQSYEITMKAIDALLSDQQGQAEQFGNILGMPQQMTPAWPGSAKANFRNQLDQMTGQAFLQIRQALKGAGAVTDYEGQRGEIALSRAQKAAESGDQKAFQQAVLDFKDAIDNGLRLLRAQAAGGYAATPGGGNAGNGGSQTSTGITWSFEP